MLGLESGSSLFFAGDDGGARRIAWEMGAADTADIVQGCAGQ